VVNGKLNRKEYKKLGIKKGLCDRKSEGIDFKDRVDGARPRPPDGGAGWRGGAPSPSKIMRETTEVMWISAVKKATKRGHLSDFSLA
jgi:hypothetical protein